MGLTFEVNNCLTCKYCIFTYSTEDFNMFYLWIQTGERYVDVSHESGLSSRTIGVVAIVGTAASSTACVRTASVGATCVGAAADDTAAEAISVLFILKIGLKKN